MICSRCVLPESTPDIVLDGEGICNICREDEAMKDAAAGGAPPLESDFVKLLHRHKGRGEYDCLVMCSGGKDSTAALYAMKKRYKLRPLVFTFDHGFETDGALDNVKNAVDALGVDFLYFRSRGMYDMFAAIVKTDSKATLCHVCSIWYMDLTFQTAARYGIPIIIAGWTQGQSKRGAAESQGRYDARQTEFVSMAKATREFLKEYKKSNPRYRDFPESMEEVLRRAEKRQRCIVLSPHWFLPYDPSISTEVIKKELGWVPARESYPAGSTNCALNFLSVHRSLKHFGYTHYHVEMSKLIRKGLLSRDDALEKLRINFGEDVLQRVTAQLLGPCGCGNAASTASTDV